MLILFTELKQAMQQTQPKAAQKLLAVRVTNAASTTEEQKAAPPTEGKVESSVVIETAQAAVGGDEESSLPKCIGPGCENNAQPDSVYCGNDCILKHAAAAMKSMTDVKEPSQKEETKKTKSSAKVPWTTRKFPFFIHCTPQL